jgi:hypothetical protein
MPRSRVDTRKRGNWEVMARMSTQDATKNRNCARNIGISMIAKLYERNFADPNFEKSDHPVFIVRQEKDRQ